MEENVSTVKRKSKQGSAQQTQEDLTISGHDGLEANIRLQTSLCAVGSATRAKDNWTPGPWGIPSDRPVTSGYIKAVKSEDLICIVQRDLNYKGEQAANARLIAASPDLLAALENLTFYVQQDGVDWPTLKRAVVQARAAIAKAEGKK